MSQIKDKHGVVIKGGDFLRRTWLYDEYTHDERTRSRMYLVLEDLDTGELYSYSGVTFRWDGDKQNPRHSREKLSDVRMDNTEVIQ